MHTQLHLHPETAFALADSGKVIPPYRATYPFAGEFINPHHRSFIECPMNGACINIGIDGWLRPADALKLYEMAFFSEGDLLELGCNRGLSSSILTRGLRDSGQQRRLVANDLRGSEIECARKNLASRHLLEYADFLMGDAAVVCRQLLKEGRRFAFVFIDHSHTYDSVAEICSMLPDLMHEGGFCLFHDYNDVRNADDDDPEYGVWQAAHDGLSKDEFQFCGVYGCSGLYRKRCCRPAA